MYRIKLLFVLFAFLTLGWNCKTSQTIVAYESSDLIIKQLTKNTYVHITFLETEQYGKVGCNGLIYVDENEAVVFDTPVNDEVSNELINWIEQNLKSKISAVVVTHFHIDCLGGLNAFHQKGIKSYAKNQTKALARAEGHEVPQNGFDNQLELTVNNRSVKNEYFGPGHTVDNIVSYIEDEKVLFGGCLIKSMGAGKGNLADADVKKWSETVEKIKEKFPKIKHVVPGHGTPGGTELLNYTIEKFEKE